MLYVDHMAPIKFGLSYMISDICEYDISSSFICDQKRVCSGYSAGNFWEISSNDPSCSSLLVEVRAKVGDVRSSPNFTSIIL